MLSLGGGGAIREADYLIQDLPNSGIKYLHRESIDHEDTWDELIQFILAFINR